MKEQKSFILYHDMQEVVEDMTDEEAGKLMKMIFRYHKTGEIEETDRIVSIAFKSFKATFERDKESYAKRCERNAYNGSKG